MTRQAATFSFLCAALCVVTASTPGSAPHVEDQQRRAGPPNDSLVILSIGVESGDSTYELSDVSSAVRLSSGEIVIVDNGRSQLRWFSPDGKFLRAAGRRGIGPNEFSTRVIIFAKAGDTVVAVDLPKNRFHHITAGGRFARTDSSGDKSPIMWLASRTIVEHTPHGSDLDRLRIVARGIPTRENELVRRAIPDSRGLLWVRPRGNEKVWVGYGAAGRAVATAELPASFEPFQIDDTVALGRDRDSLDVQRVQLRRFVRKTPPRGAAAQANAREYTTEAEQKEMPHLFATMRADLRNLVTAQEVYFASHARYSRDIPTDLGFAASRGVRIEMLKAGDKGYWLVASHVSLASVCVLGMGEGWPLRMIECL